MLNFYDFEVFKQDWLVVIINPAQRTETVIVNCRDELEAYYEAHKDEIWIGYNSRNYDQFILKGILCGFDPKEINDWIIMKKQSGYSFSSLLQKIPLINYDVMPSGVPVSLKTMEAFMGHDIKESDVPFDIDRKLNDAELQETIKYCRHDVGETIEVFLQRKADFDSHMGLIKTFHLPLSYMTKTQAQLSAAILECKRTERSDEWALFTVDTLRLTKYAYVREWFMDPAHQCYRDKDGKKMELTIEVCGVLHTFGWGGLHGAREKYHAKGLILHVDVNSYYPSLMIEYGILTRNSRNPEKYKQIYKHRLQLKKEGKKKEQAPYKIVLNGTYGISNDRYSLAYDPRNSHLVCLNGQLLLLDLLEKLEGHCTLIQSNTDGLIIEIPDTDEAFEKIDDICYEWEKRTGMKLGLDIVREIWQKDVNNYLWIDEDGKLERKGAYVKELSPLDNDLPIINQAMVDYMTKGIPVEETINCCDELIQFQKVVKLSGKYDYVLHNGRKYLYKCYRVFASGCETDGKIFKCRKGANPAKFGSTPDRCFINNDNIVGTSVPKQLDRQWYIDLAIERLKQFGVI